MYATILATVDFNEGSFSVFVIIMKVTKIAFFQFYSYAGLLEEYGIQNYKGFVPLNQLISAHDWMHINDNFNLIYYLKYISRYSVPTNYHTLLNIGVESTNYIPFPYI